MPYSTIADLPDAVKSRYSERCQAVFLKAFNAAVNPDKGGGSASEEDAFKVAHTAAGMCKDSGKAALKAEALDSDGMEAWFAGKIPRRLLAIPFGGPIPSPHGKGGVDLDGQFFSERTDILPDALPYRATDWHHGQDPTGVMRRERIGKSDNLILEPDGWWVDFWFDAGQKRIDLIRRLAERGAQLYGSSESVKGMVEVDARTGEILKWPYVRQTLSTSPQNTYSILRPLKATLDDMLSEGVLPAADLWADIQAAARNLGADLRQTSLGGDDVAKAGRVHSQTDMEAFDKAMSALKEAMDHLSRVASRQPNYGGEAAEQETP